MFTGFLTVTNLELNPISYVISGDHFKFFQRPKYTENQVLETNLGSRTFQVFQSGFLVTVSSYFGDQKYLKILVWKICQIFLRILETTYKKLLDKILKILETKTKLFHMFNQFGQSGKFGKYLFPIRA